MKNLQQLQGLIAATFTPMHDDGSIRFDRVPTMVDYLCSQGIAAMYVLGSTGEGVSLTLDERCSLAEAFVNSARGRLPVIVQVGCESLVGARMLAEHAQAAGADAVSAVCPVYFKPDSTEALVQSMELVASGAPDLPFYYYHIPAITGASIAALDFLRLASRRIATLRGIKFTSPLVHDYQACCEFEEGKYQIFWGTDEMLLSGLSTGATAAVGSTYNFAAPIYHRLLKAFAAGDLEEARRQQSVAQAIVRAFVRYGARAAQKAIMAMIGQDCGKPRLPVLPLTDDAYSALHGELQSIGLFDQLQAHAQTGPEPN